MRTFWLCELVEFPRSGFWEPLICQIARANGNFPIAFSTTDALRGFKYAVGVAECTSAQFAAIQADVNVSTFDESLLFTTFGSLNGAVRNKINAFLDSAGIARPVNAEVIHDLWSRIAVVVDFKTVDQLLAILQSRIDNP